MKRLIKAFFDNEILSYLFFGGATTLVSISSRLVIYHISHQEILATALANIIGILFLTYIFVTSYPDIIGQFVNGQLDQVNAIETLIAQVLIIILNYIFSKVYVFYK